jgi:hypothetical protein
MNVTTPADSSSGETAPTRRLAGFAALIRGDSLPADIKIKLGEL